MTISTTQNLSQPTSPIIPFDPQTDHERVTADVVRTMLKFEVIRVQLESDLLDLTPSERATLRHEASSMRIAGFRAQREAAEQGMPFSYDDEMLRREGTRIAYLIRRDAEHQARLIEEEVIGISVNKALYGIDEESLSIAIAA